MARKYKKISISNDLLQPKSGNSLINIKNQICKQNIIQNKNSYVPINGEIFENSHEIKENIFNVNVINDFETTHNIQISLLNKTLLNRKYIFNFQQENTDLTINLSLTNSSIPFLDIGSYIKIVASKNIKSQKFKIFYNGNRYTEYFSFENGNIFNDIIFYWTGNEWKLTYDQNQSNLNNTFKTVWNDSDIIKNEINDMNQFVNYSTGLTNNLIGNSHVNLSSNIAFPSNIGTLNIENIKSNFNNLKKFIKKENIQNNKFISFIDKKYPKNSSIIHDENFIKGLGKFNLDSNLYEETSIEIELDNPTDVFLQHTAVIQETQISDNNDTWSTDVYPETFHKANTPFVMYNFSDQCWQYRGIHKPYIQFNDINALDIDYLTSSFNNDVVNYFNTIDVNVDDSQLITTKKRWRIFYQKYIMNHDPLTSTHTQSLRLNNKPNSQNEDVYKYQNFLSIPTQQFGFPHSSKFHGFDYNVLKINKYINKPFIIDRVEFNANVEVKGEISYIDSKKLETPFNISLNFFILNQRKKSKFSINTFKGVETKYFSNFSNGIHSLTNFNTSKFIMTNSSINQGVLTTPSSWDLYIDNKKVYQEFMFQDEYSPYIPTIDNNTGLYLSQGIDDNLFDINHTKTFKIFISNANVDNYSFDEFKTTTLNINTHDGEYTREIITYGNALFYSHFNKRWNGSSFVNISSNIKDMISKTIQNNNDLYIDTTPSQNALDNIYQDNEINTGFNYANNISIKAVVKSPKECNININNHLINNQILIPTSNPSNIKLSTSVVYSGNQYESINNSVDENAYSGTRYLERKISGRNQNDSYNNLNVDLPLSDIELRNDTVLTDLNVDYLDKMSIKIDSGVKLTNQSSPYVLMPSDNLLFCLSTSNLISSNLIKQVVKIKKGKVKFVLHGYIPKNNRMIVDYKNLKDLNTDNFSSNIIGNTFVNDNFSELFEKSELFNCYLDRIFKGDFFLNTRKLNDDNIVSSSKIKSGSAFIPYVILENLNFKKDSWIYDDFDLILKIKEIFYDQNGVGLLSNQTKLINIIRNMKFYKSNNTNDNLTLYFGTYRNNIEPSKSNIKKKCSYKSYGQYCLNFGQRLFTTYSESYGEKNFQKKTTYVIEQKFIDNLTGEEITNMSNIKNRNKSKTLELYDSGYKSINENGDITKWNYEDFLSLKHVAFNDTSFNVIYNNN